MIPNIGSHLVTVQGIADLLFEEEDGFVLVDFKTDHVANPAALSERYEKQMRLYAKMLGKITPKPIKEQIIYSLYQGREIVL